MNKVVARFQSGRLIKGLTNDFTAAKERFHIIEEGVPLGTPPREVLMSDLKGLFFVRDLAGDFGHAKSNAFDQKDLRPGRRIRIRFKDGETMVALTQAYSPGRTGFFVEPADRNSNTERCYIVVAATEDVAFL